VTVAGKVEYTRRQREETVNRGRARIMTIVRLRAHKRTREGRVPRLDSL
jgi:hypothetical protein